MKNIVQNIVNPFAHAFSIALANYPLAIVQNAEKIYKLETGNYTSTIWKKTKGAGAEASNTQFPYGWSNFTTFWSIPWLRPIGLYSVNGNNYIKFPTFTAGLLFVCKFLSLNGNNPGAWNSTDAIAQSNYDNSLNGIVNTYAK